jgi:hypothetical protein
LADFGDSAHLFDAWNLRRLEFHRSTKMSANIDQFSYFEKLATLTRLYLELSLPVPEALRAAKADL